MTDNEIIEAVEIELNDERLNTFVPSAVARAESAIIQRQYPYNDDAIWDDVPEKHHPKAVDMAVYLVNRRGAEGETSHSEAGVSRSYEDAGIPESFFKGIVPKAGIPR